MPFTNSRHLHLPLLALLLSAAAQAAPVTFTIFPNKLNLLTAESKTVVENVLTRTGEISGTLTYDAAAKTGSGVITVNGASIKTGIAQRDGHMRSSTWFDFDKNPTIKFETVSVKNVGADLYEVTGKLTLHGVTKTLTSRATVKFTPASAATRAAGAKGDVLAVTTTFKINLSDYNVTNPRIPGQVNNTLNVTLKFLASSE